MHREIVKISPGSTLQEASQVMNQKEVGALSVREGEDYAGIISEKRLARDGMVKGLNPATTLVRAIMRAAIATVSIDVEQSVRAARDIMEAFMVRHLVVKESSKVVGIITLSDLIRYYAEFFE